MQPRYKETRQYESASRYITKQDQIITSKKSIKQHKRCKYQTRSKIAARVERYFIKKRENMIWINCQNTLIRLTNTSVFKSIFIANKIKIV